MDGAVLASGGVAAVRGEGGRALRVGGAVTGQRAVGGAVPVPLLG